MKIFSIKEDGKFEEFSQTYFHVDHEESVLENWLENNSDLVGRGGFLSKLDATESEMNQFWQEAQATGLFQPAGRELKSLINRKFNTVEIQTLITWLEKVATAIENHELK